MTNNNYEILELTQLTHVFGSEFAEMKWGHKYHTYDITNPSEIIKAVQCLLIPQFEGYDEERQIRLINTLRAAIANPDEDFKTLIRDTSNTIFVGELQDRRAFMIAVLAGLALEPLPA